MTSLLCVVGHARWIRGGKAYASCCWRRAPLCSCGRRCGVVCTYMTVAVPVVCVDGLCRCVLCSCVPLLASNTGT